MSEKVQTDKITCSCLELGNMCMAVYDMRPCIVFERKADKIITKICKELRVFQSPTRKTQTRGNKS